MNPIYIYTALTLIMCACLYVSYELHCIRRGIPVKKYDTDKDKYI